MIFKVSDNFSMSASADDGAMHLKAAKPPSELLLPYSTVNSGAPVTIVFSLDKLYKV